MASVWDQAWTLSLGTSTVRHRARDAVWPPNLRFLAKGPRRAIPLAWAPGEDFLCALLALEGDGHVRGPCSEEIAGPHPLL